MSRGALAICGFIFISSFQNCAPSRLLSNSIENVTEESSLQSDDDVQELKDLSLRKTSCQPEQTGQNFVYRSCGEAPSLLNYGRRLPDQTITNGALTLTTSTALGGAIASVQWQGIEFIESAGHGAAFQHAIHAWPEGSHPTECDNPTEAGSWDDDFQKTLWYGLMIAPKASSVKTFGNVSKTVWLPDARALLSFPFHGSSSTGILEHRPLAKNSLFTHVNMANFVAPSSNSEHDGCDANIYTKMATDFYLKKTLTLGGTTGNSLEKNVLRVETELTTPKKSDNLDAILVAYLQGYFDQEVFYDLINGATYNKARGEARFNKKFINSTDNHVLRVFMSSSKGVGVGVLTTESHLKRGGSALSSTTYTLSEKDLIAPNVGYAHKFNNIATQVIYKNLRAGDVIHGKTYFIFGTLEEIKKTAINLRPF